MVNMNAGDYVYPEPDETTYLVTVRVSAPGLEQHITRPVTTTSSCPMGILQWKIADEFDIPVWMVQPVTYHQEP